MRPRNDRLERRVVLQLRGRQCCCPVTGMGITLPVRTDRSGKVMLQAYDEGRLDKLYIVSSKNLLTPCLRFRPSASCCRYRHQMMMIKTQTRITCTNPIRRRCWIPAASLCRISGLSGVVEKPGQRAGRPYGGDESRDRQWRQPD